MMSRTTGGQSAIFSRSKPKAVLYLEVCNSFRSSAQRMAADNVGTLGEKRILWISPFSELLNHAQRGKRKTAAGIAVRLTEAAVCNESIGIPEGAPPQEAAHVDMSRTGYATLLAKSVLTEFCDIKARLELMVYQPQPSKHARQRCPAATPFDVHQWLSGNCPKRPPWSGRIRDHWEQIARQLNTMDEHLGVSPLSI